MRSADKQRQAAEVAEEKERQDEERKRVAAERAKRAEQKKRDDQLREAARRANEKQKTFANITRLPVARHEKELARLAKRLDEGAATLREEFAEFLGVASEPAETTEPWPEPVNIAVVLQELGDKISRYVVMQKHQLIAAQLWTAHTWLYDHQVPIHSPILAATSAEPNSGKHASRRRRPRVTEIFRQHRADWTDAVPVRRCDKAHNRHSRSRPLVRPQVRFEAHHQCGLDPRPEDTAAG